MCQSVRAPRIASRDSPMPISLEEPRVPRYRRVARVRRRIAEDDEGLRCAAPRSSSRWQTPFTTHAWWRVPPASKRRRDGYRRRSASTSLIRPVRSVSSARAMRSTLRRPMFRRPRSTSPMYAFGGCPPPQPVAPETGRGRSGAFGRHARRRRGVRVCHSGAQAHASCASDDGSTDYEWRVLGFVISAPHAGAAR